MLHGASKVDFSLRRAQNVHSEVEEATVMPNEISLWASRSRVFGDKHFV